MAERRWQAVIWIRCFTRRRFSSSRKNCMGVVLGGTSRMTVPRNSTVLRAAMVVDSAEPTQRFRPDCRKWVIRFCISMRRNTAPTIPSSKSSAYRAVNYHSDREGTQLNYEVLSEAVSAVRCSVPLGTNWKKRIDEDFNSRKDGRK